jgi:hypothetical protein
MAATQAAQGAVPDVDQEIIDQITHKNAEKLFKFRSPFRTCLQARLQRCPGKPEPATRIATVGAQGSPHAARL